MGVYCFVYLNRTRKYFLEYNYHHYPCGEWCKYPRLTTPTMVDTTFAHGSLLTKENKMQDESLDRPYDGQVLRLPDGRQVQLRSRYVVEETNAGRDGQWYYARFCLGCKQMLVAEDALCECTNRSIEQQ